jgi:hypothetical protein
VYLERNHIKNMKRDAFMGVNIFMCSMYHCDVVTNERSVIAVAFVTKYYLLMI